MLLDDVRTVKNWNRNGVSVRDFQTKSNLDWAIELLPQFRKEAVDGLEGPMKTKSNFCRSYGLSASSSTQNCLNCDTVECSESNEK